MNIEFEVIQQYAINKKKIRGLVVEIEPTPEILENDMVGVAVDFAMPDGRTMETPIDKCWMFNGVVVLFFNNLTGAYKAVGFSDPDGSDNDYNSPPDTA